MTTLDRYVIFEALQFLTFGTLSVVGIFFATVEFKHILEMLGLFAVPVGTILTFNLLQLPTGVMYCLPAGILVSVILVLARMHDDSEIVALQAAGVSRLRIFKPLVTLGIACSIVSFAIGEHVAPRRGFFPRNCLI